MTTPFSDKLVLDRWVLGELGVGSFHELAEYLRDEGAEGLDESNVHHFHHELRRIPPRKRPRLPDDLLLAYDQSIAQVTTRINDARRRNHQRPVRWKYFQYLSLLFTEIYLDRYFRSPERLVTEINERVQAHNADLASHVKGALLQPLNENGDPRRQLNKLAFWMATGSGKTLLMHAHILRFLALAEGHGQAKDINRILLLTPNEGMSRQHLREFAQSEIPARIFSKGAVDLFHERRVEILDIHKLSDEMGDKTVAASAFEGNNLVLVDEGHRGVAAGKSGEWMRRRQTLCEEGFSFEYSATFGQAVKGSPELEVEYARCTLVDYSYRWFHRDGFGKDYRILNIDTEDEEWRGRYLTAALMTFFQQQWLRERHEEAFRPYNIERPLCVFVGSRVTKSLSTFDASDVVEILQFLAGFLSDEQRATERIKHVMSDDPVHREGSQQQLAGHFRPLREAALGSRDIFRAMLSTTFNAPSGGSLLIERLKGSPGELALRAGDNAAPFGVINVGDPAELAGLCEDAGLAVVEREFADSLFRVVNEPDSTIHMVIGARKFTEGWNSWRVSTMGLMNVGRSEGSQIIQLFGRGVRLKGRDMSLKRSSADRAVGPEPPHNLQYLETLNVFGVRAGYMAQFRDFLQDEGLAVDPFREVIPIQIPELPEGLKLVRVAESVAGDDPAGAFRRRGPRMVLRAPGDADLDSAVAARLRRPVVLDWYPRVQAIQSGPEAAWGDEHRKDEGELTGDLLHFVDWDALYIKLRRFKADRGWHNLSIASSVLRELLHESAWYQLRIPASELQLDSMRKAWQIQEIALALLKKYVTRYYGVQRQAWEAEHLEYRTLDATDANFPQARGSGGPVSGYGIVVRADASQADEIRRWVDRMKSAVSAATVGTGFNGPEAGPLDAVALEQHLYAPLLVSLRDQQVTELDDQAVTLTPPGLNRGEHRFVRDFREFCERTRPIGVRLHLLRNLSRGHGVGFFEANNFHPDFILWAVTGSRQHIGFLDPKGLVHAGGPHDPKVRLHDEIKEIQRKLGDPDVSLDSFILSVTPFGAVGPRWNMTREELADLHVLFMEDPKTYVAEVLWRMGVRLPH